jgi:hypothetical protein
MLLHHLIYFSRNSVSGDDRAHINHLRDILSASQRNNRRQGITGYLIYDKHWFLQVLEGERATIFNTFERLQNDPRHRGLTLVQSGPVLQRNFPSWNMGGSMRTVEKQEIFLRYGIASQIDPKKLTGGTILNLAIELQAYEQEQRAALRSTG